MRILGQDPAKAATSEEPPYTAVQGEKHPDTEQSDHESARSRGVDTPGAVAKVVAAARGVPEAKKPAEPTESPDNLRARPSYHRRVDKIEPAMVMSSRELGPSRRSP